MNYDLMITKALENRNCDIHGQYESAFIECFGKTKWTNCPGCIQQEKDFEREGRFKRLESERKQLEVQSIIKRAAIPPAFDYVDFSAYILDQGDEQLKVFNNCKYFADNFDKAIKKNIHGILFGNSRTGKTFLSIAMIKRVMEQGYTGLFTSMADISLSLKESYGDKNKSESEILRGFINIDFLVIDECGIKQSEFEIEKLFYIVNTRLNFCRPTIILTNELFGLEEKIGTRVFNRMQESRFVMNFNWNSHFKDRKGH